MEMTTGKIIKCVIFDFAIPLICLYFCIAFGLWHLAEMYIIIVGLFSLLICAFGPDILTYMFVSGAIGYAIGHFTEYNYVHTVYLLVIISIPVGTLHMFYLARKL